MLQSQQTERMRDARARLLLTHPFFGVLSLKLELVESAAVQTIAVNTVALHFNPAWIANLTSAELKGLWAHEVMHLALGHHARQGARDPDMWNEAGDFAINPALISDGFTLPGSPLIDSAYADLSAEQIYQRLQDQKQPDPEQPESDQSQGQDPGQQGTGNAAGDAGEGQPEPGQGQPQPQPGAGAPSTGSFESAGAEDSAEARDSEREWRENAQEALRAAASAGKMPAGIRREIDKASRPKADWKTLLRRFVNDQIRTRSSWTLRNKRFPDICLPGRVRDGMGSVAWLIDTSGSIYANPAALARFQAESNAVIQDCEPAQVYVVYCDSAVRHVDVFEHGEPIILKPVGGGGTLFQPALDWLEENGIDPACAVYLTDLENGSERLREPGYPVLWATYDARGAVAPFGETVAID